MYYDIYCGQLISEKFCVSSSAPLQANAKNLIVFCHSEFDRPPILATDWNIVDTELWIRIYYAKASKCSSHSLRNGASS